MKHSEVIEQRAQRMMRNVLKQVFTNRQEQATGKGRSPALFLTFFNVWFDNLTSVLLVTLL